VTTNRLGGGHVRTCVMHDGWKYNRKGGGGGGGLRTPRTANYKTRARIGRQGDGFGARWWCTKRFVLSRCPRPSPVVARRHARPSHKNTVAVSRVYEVFGRDPSGRRRPVPVAVVVPLRRQFGPRHAVRGVVLARGLRRPVVSSRRQRREQRDRRHRKMETQGWRSPDSFAPPARDNGPQRGHAGAQDQLWRARLLAGHQRRGARHQQGVQEEPHDEL